MVLEARYDLVVFDLDGTLVDSESMAERVVAASMFEVTGKSLTTEEIAGRFRGRTVQYIVDWWREQYDQDITDAFVAAIYRRYPEAVRSELRASVGAIDTIEKLSGVPVCVASNGEPAGVRLSLEFTGLLPFFGNNVFTAHDVENPKPAPDLFLHAAAAMGVAPEKCLVVEDSVTGVVAATAAGMAVVGYTGNHPEVAGELTALGAIVIEHFDELPPLVLI